MALEKNRQAVLAILQEIEPRILGKPHSGFTCNCGACHEDPGIANAIIPGGDTYPGSETEYWSWEVRVSNHPEIPAPAYNFSVLLTEFIPHEEIKAIFAKHFDQKPDANNPYRLKINGAERVWGKLPAAVCIKDNESQTRFKFDWGKEQEVPNLFFNQFNMLESIEKDDPKFASIITILRLLKPEVYRGGPDPKLPFESSWLLDYHAALDMVSSNAVTIFTQNIGSHGDSRGSVETHADIVFVKHKK